MKIRYYHLFFVVILSIIMFTVFSCSDSVNEEDPVDDKDSNADVSNTPNNGDIFSRKYTGRLYSYWGSENLRVPKTIYLVENNYIPIKHLKLPDIKEFCLDEITPGNLTEVIFHGGYFNVLKNNSNEGEIIIDNDEKLNKIKDETLQEQQDLWRWEDHPVTPYADESIYRPAITLYAKCDCSVYKYEFDTNSDG